MISLSSPAKHVTARVRAGCTIRLLRGISVAAAAILTLAALASCSSPEPVAPQLAAPRPAPTVVTKIVLPTRDASAPASSATFANYFGTVTIGGSPAKDGLVVEIFTAGGTLIGKATTTQGWYPYTRAFGADELSRPPVLGAKNGEDLVFKVDGRRASTSLTPVSWKNDPAPVRVDLTAAEN